MSVLIRPELKVVPMAICINDVCKAFASCKVPKPCKPAPSRVVNLCNPCPRPVCLPALASDILRLGPEIKSDCCCLIGILALFLLFWFVMLAISTLITYLTSKIVPCPVAKKTDSGSTTTVHNLTLDSSTVISNTPGGLKYQYNSPTDPIQATTNPTKFPPYSHTGASIFRLLYIPTPGSYPNSITVSATALLNGAVTAPNPLPLTGTLVFTVGYLSPSGYVPIATDTEDLNIPLVLLTPLVVTAGMTGTLVPTPAMTIGGQMEFVIEISTVETNLIFQYSSSGGSITVVEH